MDVKAALEAATEGEEVKYPSALHEALASVKRVGVRRTASLAVSRVLDTLFDNYHGVDTAKRIELEDLDIQADTAQQGQMYQPTGVLPFREVMRRVNFPSPGVFVDYGCGKGRTLLLASMESFRRVIGIEFSEELCRDAKRNADIFKRKGLSNCAIEVVHQDAAKYEYDGSENIFYFFYPFDADLMKRVLDQIEASLQEHPRNAVLVYYYPIHREVLDDSMYFLLQQEFELFGYTCLVYRHDAIS